MKLKAKVIPSPLPAVLYCCMSEWLALNEKIDKVRIKKRILLTQVNFNQKNCLLHEVGLGGGMDVKVDCEARIDNIIIITEQSNDRFILNGRCAELFSKDRESFFFTSIRAES